MSSQISKEYSSSASPLHRYLFEHMTPLSAHMAQLRAASLQDPMGRMLGASDELNFLQMLIATLAAKKTLDIGVFTGYRQVQMIRPSAGPGVDCRGCMLYMA